jgi:hypothetical protein
MFGYFSAMLNKADVLSALADDILTATARNYYISSTIELRELANKLFNGTVMKYLAIIVLLLSIFACVNKERQASLLVNAM